MAQSFTSTTHVPVTENEAAIVDRDILRYRLVKSKGMCVCVYVCVCVCMCVYVCLIIFWSYYTNIYWSDYQVVQSL